MKVELHSITPQVEETIVEIARVSSPRKDKKESPEGLIRYLIKNKHWSPFEMGHMTIMIETSRAISTQFLRHRSFSFQQLSQRYASGCALESLDFRLQADKNRQSSTISLGGIDEGLESHYNTEDEHYREWIDEVAKSLRDIQSLYNRGIEMGIAKECARFILPEATKTVLYMAGSIRSWVHLIQIRDEEHAQWEAQVIAKEIKNIFKEHLPIIGNALDF